MYFIVNPKMIGKIYDNKDFDIDLLQFKTENAAQHYLLKHGHIKKDNINKDNIKKDDLIENDTINVFTDGACSNNGKVGATAGIGVYFGKDDSRNVSKKIDGKQTNNTAELSAVIEVFNILSNDIKQFKNIIVYTD